MNRPLIPCALLAGLFASSAAIQAQHYPIGAEGLKGASLPPPGLYLRDYNIGYYADRFQGGPPGFEASAYVNAPRLIWMSEWKILGADYGMDLMVPFGYKHIKYAGFDRTSFGLLDMGLEPALLSWHFSKLDLSAAYAVWAPTGEFSPNRPDHLGSGYWGHMLTLGGTYYFDQEKTWALSVLNRYEINHEQEKTHITLGNTYSVELGLSKTLKKVWDVGLVGYCQQQVTEDSGAGARSDKPGVAAIGPEISLAFPKITTFASLRFLREFTANDRPEGNTFSLTITKRF